jgi:hypothetical protein
MSADDSGDGLETYVNSLLLCFTPYHKKSDHFFIDVDVTTCRRTHGRNPMTIIPQDYYIRERILCRVT